VRNWERFDRKSRNYDLYRPRYPKQLLTLLEKEVGLNKSSIVADVGSGTGLLSELLLKSGCSIFCVEPNEEMRNIAREKFAKVAKCTVLDGTAENTSLPDNSIDLITAGQAFHWFDETKSKKEFNRILKRDGLVALVWNTRLESSEGMNSEYEKLVRKYSVGYHASGHLAVSKDVIEAFFDGNFRSFIIKNDQLLDLEGMLGRYLSASYAIDQRDKNFEQMKREFSVVFKRFEVNGYITIEYETEVFLGTIGK
jgi:ubiquinone/menaquinone biosynthesis C-methylase UbiE